MQHTDGGWNGNHSLRYHLCITSEDVDLTDAVAPAHRYSIQGEVPTNREVPLGDVDPLYMTVEKDGKADYVNRNTISVKMTKEMDDNSGKAGRLDYSMDATVWED